MIQATYSPEDNKLRLYSVGRFDPETFTAAKSHGFIWAPKQGLLVAPAWSPERDDFARSVADSGEIEPEETSMAERAAQRAERFDTYSEHRERDAAQARAGFERLADGIPLGQPILVGHHSERHARKDQARLERLAEAADRNWKTAVYWERRAADLLHHCERMDNPGVRVRRIKTLQADLRKCEKTKDHGERFAKLWRQIETHADPRKAALFLANHDHVSRCFTLAEYPRDHDTYEGSQSLWGALERNIIDPLRAMALSLETHSETAARMARWIEHLTNRIVYETAVLNAQGHAMPEKTKRTAPKLPPLLNVKAESITVKNPYRAEPMTLPVESVTAAEWAKIAPDYKCTRVAVAGFRVRTALRRGNSLAAIFLTDAKEHAHP